MLFRIVFHFLLLFIGFFPLLSQADESVGFVSGAFAVNEMGAATYSVPIDVPPGINGMQPSLALNYDSQSGAGELGVGWGLAGLSSISRCPTNLEMDARVDGVDYDNHDFFCLDGSRLIWDDSRNLFTPDSGSSVRVVPVGRNTSAEGGWSPSYWKVFNSDGSTQFYGAYQTTNGVVVDTNARKYRSTTGDDVQRWMISAQRDQFNNEVRYKYDMNRNLGVLRISSIEYGNNHVVSIHWSNDRPDRQVGFYPGGAQFLLDAIVEEISVDGGLWSYQVDYSYSNGKPYVRAISKCSESDCLSPFTPKWSPTSSGFGAMGKKLNNFSITQGWRTTHEPRFMSDADGDGIADIIAFGAGGVWVSLADGNGGFKEPLKALSSFSYDQGWRVSHEPRFMSDVDGDGVADIVGFGAHGVWVSIADGDGGFDEPVKKLNNFSITQGWRVDVEPRRMSDVNGDGIADIVGFGAHGVWVSLADGQGGFEEPVKALNNFSITQGWRVEVEPREMADVNGDGLADIVGFGAHGVWVSLADGFGGFEEPEKALNNFSITQGWRVEVEPRQMADVNGDGLADIVGFGAHGVWVSLADGRGGFTEPKKEVDNFSITQGWRVSHEPRFVVDMNSDGMADIVGFGGGGVWIALANGLGGFDALQRRIDNYSYDQGWTVENEPRRLADINGDGTVDIVGFGGHGVWVSLNNWHNRNVITFENQTSGTKTEVFYESGTGGLISDADDVTRKGSIDIHAPIQLVTKVRGFTGVSAEDEPGWATTTYGYAGFRVHRRGLGSLGFREIESTDQTTGISTVTTYSQRWENRTTGMVESSRTITANGTALSESVNQLENFFEDAYEDRFLPYIKATTSVQRDLDGRVINTTTLENSLLEGKGWVAREVSCVAPNDLFDGLIVPCNSSEMVNNREIYKTTDYTYLPKSEAGNFAPLLDRKTTTIEIPNVPPFQDAREQRIVEYRYNLSTGQIKSETLEPDNDKKWLTKSYTYHSSGQIETTTVSGADIKPRTSKVVYNSSTKLPAEKRNALGHIQKLIYGDARFPWLPTKVIAPDGNWVKNSYDSWGGVRRTEKGHGTNIFSWSESNKAWCENSQRCNGDSDELFFVKSSASLGQPSFVFFDSLGREVRSLSYGLRNGEAAEIHRSTKYNKRGLVSWSGHPSFEFGSNLGSITEYDELGRVLDVTHADHTKTKTRYSGRKVVYTDEKGNTKTIIKNSLGQKIQARDTRNNPISYEYDAFGNMVLMDDFHGNITRIGYDIRGFKTQMDDPDQGKWTYRYNVLGELIEQTDAKNQTTRMSYDLLGRMLTRTDNYGSTNAQTSNWHYDDTTQSPAALGKLWKITNNSNFQQEMSYNGYGWHNKTTTTIDNHKYVSRNTYDVYGRVVNTIYPTGYSVQNRYHSQLGTLHSINQTGSNGDAPIWQAINANARGQLEQEKIGKYINRTQRHDDKSGLVENIYSSNSTSGLVYQSLSYQWDDVGNLKSFSDELPGVNVSETYIYDDLYRLEDVVTAHGTQSTRYNDLGNIVSKSGVGSYSYNNGSVPTQCGALNHVAGPHSVRSITGVQSNYFCYDANGNVIKDKTRSLTYTGFNKPNKIVRGNTVVKFEYGPDRNRFKRVETKGSSTTTTHYVGGYEKIIAGGKTKHRITVAGVALVIQGDGLTNINFLLKDQLGSITSIVNQSGIPAETMSFDAWGNRRLTDGMMKSSPSNFTNRGYTGHEHVDSVGLIHMNGRVYDAQVSRFVSPDPIVQAPTNLQSLNRYSYVFNNPLSHTDPSGYRSLKSELESLDNRLKRYVTGAVAWVVTGQYFGGEYGYNYRKARELGMSVSDAQKFGVKTTAISAASKGLSYWAGNVLEGVAWAQRFGTEYYAHIIAEGVSRVVVHGTIGGSIAKVSGGKFVDGFAVSGVRALYSFGYGTYGGDGAHGFFKFADNWALATIEQAAVATATAKLQGADVARSVKVALAGYFFNELLHPSAQEDVGAGKGPLLDSYDEHVDANGTAYRYDSENGWYAYDGGIEASYPEQMLGFAGLGRLGVSLGYKSIAALTTMGSPTYSTFAAGSMARSTLKWLTFGPVIAGRAPKSPSFYWNKAGGDFSTAVKSLSHSNSAWDNALIPFAPLSTGGY